jgi:hypothetical protein
MKNFLPFLAVWLLAGPALAAEGISKTTDHVLWCASAYAQLANDASEQSDAADTALYDNLAATLTRKGIDLLRADLITDDRITAIIQAYDDAVYAQLETPAAPYPIESCEGLITG